MSRYPSHQGLDIHDDPVLKVHKRGADLLSDPLLNKGTGFPDSERDALGLRGLVPPQVVSIDDQVQRVMENYHRKTNDLERYIHIESLHDRNETLYFRVLLEHVSELTPIVYTPVVGKACQEFGHIYRRARGMYFNAMSQPYFEEMVNNWHQDQVDVIVVTDGSRILGLGDLGANGMGIPIGKLALYVLGAGIQPWKTLPVMLDLGTNNKALRDDTLYLGERRARLQGDDYYKIVDDFIKAAHKRWPQALIQFEDFSNDHALPLLNKYRDQILTFNDDIQGTGAVALAGILGAMKIIEGTLAEQRIVFFGAGSAARGIADMLVVGMVEGEGLTPDEARSRIWMIDTQGLVTSDRTELASYKRDYAHSQAPIQSLVDVIRSVRPTILIGVSGQAGSFDQESLQTMRQHCPRPIILALSNPTSKAECTAEQAYSWTEGDAIFASGSPFAPVTYKGRIFVPGQGNNMYIFPGVGMGAVACKASKVTDRMFYAASQALAAETSEDSLSVGRLYPDLRLIREISLQIAIAVCEIAFEQGIAGIDPPDDLSQFIRQRMYQPHYVPYQPA